MNMSPWQPRAHQPADAALNRFSRPIPAAPVRVKPLS